MAPILLVLLGQLSDEAPPLPDLLEVDSASIARGLLTRTTTVAPPVGCQPSCGVGARCLPSDHGLVCVREEHLGDRVAQARMGLAGQWVIDSRLGLGLFQSWTAPEGQQNITLGLAPVASYFVVDDLALVMGLELQLSAINDFTVFVLGGTAGLSYYVDLGAGFGLWPGVDGSVAWTRASRGSLSFDEPYLGLTARAPALLHVLPGFFVGLGPKFEWVRLDEVSRFTLGFSWLIGFYL